MPTTTPAPNLMPYPVGTDRVMDGDNAMQALAERVDTRMGKWTAYTPSIVSGASYSSAVANYLRTTDLVTVRARFTMTTFGTNGAPARIALPINADPEWINGGVVSIGRTTGLRQGARHYYGEAVLWDTGTFAAIDPTTAAYWYAGSPVAWATGDLWTFVFSYRPAPAN